MTKAVISYGTIEQRWNGIPEEVDTIEITHALQAIKHLAIIANHVNENPDDYCDGAKAMAHLIREIGVAVMPPEEVKKRIAEHFRHL